jgi:hypothetical protein
MPSAVSSTLHQACRHPSPRISAPPPAPRRPLLPQPARALAGRRRGGRSGPGAGGGQRLSVQQHQPRPAATAGIGDRARGRPVGGLGLPARRAVVTGGGRGCVNQKWPRTSPGTWHQPLRARGHELPAQARPRDTRFGRSPGDRIPHPPDPSAHRRPSLALGPRFARRCVDDSLASSLIGLPLLPVPIPVSGSLPPTCCGGPVWGGWCQPSLPSSAQSCAFRVRSWPATARRARCRRV